MSAPSHLPVPPRERWPLVAALLALIAGAALLALVLTGVLDGRPGPAAAAAAPPPAPHVVVVVPAPAPAHARPVVRTAAPEDVTRRVDERRFIANDRSHVPAAWVARFYDIYAAAQRTYGVNWLLIASVHKQETAFSTHPTTYHGLNSVRCCAGPMQFNVRNGPLTTWDRYRSSFRGAARPPSYPHRTRFHPSVYDDFDSIMAAAALLRDSGAGLQLDANAWRAAYDYYGHDLTGVTYANEVLARAIGWGRRSFCINCETDPALRGAVDAAWGEPVRAEMQPAHGQPGPTTE